MRVSADQAVRQACATRSVTGAGVARRGFTTAADGYVTARLSGPVSSDWDLAVVDKATGNVLNGAAALGSDEIATTRVRRGQELLVQSCRRSGPASSVGLSVQFTEATLRSSTGKVKLVRVDLGSQFERVKLSSLQLDTTDHPAPSYQDVLLHSAGDEAKLRQAGFSFQVRNADVVASDRTARRTEQAASRSAKARAAARAATPSGRTSYRTLPEHEQELKDLAAANPGLVRVFELGRSSIEGRPITGIEIAENVGNPPDGRPAYVQVGTHHAREWPANEATIEFGRELIDGYKTGNPDLRAIVQQARTYVIPVLNVDGFDMTIESEGLNPDGSYEDPVDSGGTSGRASEGSGAYKRKNCRAPTPDEQAIPCLARTYDPAAGADQSAHNDRGVDPNRNYGVEWGGPGTTSDPNGLTYHGTGPFSEPETQAFREFVRNLQVTVLITNHTYTGLILRPPGTSTFGPVPDEQRLRALGDAMAAETDYISQFSYQLYDTTGTTDDYIYNGLNAFSYTPEIGKVEFHPEYTTGFIPEYDGRPETDESGNPTGNKLGGLRKAFTLAGLTAIDADSHSLLQGTAPAGRVLRIAKTITNQTSTRPDGDSPDDGLPAPALKGLSFSEDRTSTMVVPGDGRFTWHVSPSSQPRADQAAWRLTCEDGAGNVLESRDVLVGRAQTVDLALTCGTQPSTTSGPGGPTCVNPDGFRSAKVARRGSGLRITFSRKVRNPVTVDVFQTSKGRRSVPDTRVIRFRNRRRSFTWNGRGTKGKRLGSGVYYVRFRVTDAHRRVDSRRIVVERRKGRFTKRGTSVLEGRCPG